MKILLDHGGSMERRDVIKKFEGKFVQGDGKIYLNPEELGDKEYEEHWYNALGWARSELRVEGLLHSRNPLGLWSLTAEGEKAANKLPNEDLELYF